MLSTYSRRGVLLTCGLAVGLGTGGCLGESPQNGDGRESDTTDSTETNSRPVTSNPPTVSSSVVSDEEARERALAAEEAHLTDAFENASCVEEWGLTPYVGQEREATVTDRTEDGVRVRVTHPYWYSTEQVDADSRSDARYLVTAEDSRRIGDDVSPC